MARYPGGTWRPLPENETQSKIRPTQVILHTAVDAPGPTRLERYFARTDVTLESHFWIPLDGEIIQMMDTEVRADANYRANKRPDGTGAISIETEDEGDPEGVPWTAKQLDSLEAVCRWASMVHGIPLKLVDGPDVPGLGYHAMFGGPSAWTPSRGKTCPGDTRIKQIHQDLLPRFSGEGVIVMTKDEARAKAAILYAAILGRAGDAAGLEWWATKGEGMSELDFFWSFLASSQKELENRVASRAARLAALEAALEENREGALLTPAVDVDKITEAVAARIIERLSQGL